MNVDGKDQHHQSFHSKVTVLMHRLWKQTDCSTYRYH